MADVEYTDTGIPRITVRPESGADSWDAFPLAEKADPWADFPKAESRAADFAKSTGVGVGKGLIGLGGLGGDVRELITKGAGALGVSPETTKKAIAGAPIFGPALAVAPTSADIRGTVEGVTGEFYKPQYQTGEYGQTIGEFLPAALAGPGGVARKVAMQAALPGAASEGAGQLAQTYAPATEPYVRAGAGIATGVGGAMLARPATAGRAIQGQLPEYVTPAHVQRAEALIQAAQQRGITLTWPEALSQVTGRPVLTDMQRILESSAASRPQMQAFMGERPQQMRVAADQTFGELAPATAEPSMIGRGTQAAAQGAISERRGAINRRTQPYYQAAEETLLTPDEMAQVRAIPGYERARDAVRNNEQINRYVAHLPDNSVGFLNEVKQYFDRQVRNARNRFNPDADVKVAAGLEQDARAVRQAAVDASRRVTPPGQESPYEVALNAQQQTRQQYLEPLKAGPLGKVAKTRETQRATEALFPSSPLASSEHEVSEAVRLMAQRNPLATMQLVRAHAERTFNEAIQNLQPGFNEFGGAKFAAVLSGNRQQWENLRAAVEALPRGQERWRNFDAFLEVLEATGKRQAIGSKTAFNAEELKALGAGGALVGTAKFAGSPGKWWTIVHDRLAGWQQGRNLEQLAHILTDPRSGPLLQRLADLPRRSREAGVAAARIILQANQSLNRPAAEPQKK
jgi:hypothetical protein